MAPAAARQERPDGAASWKAVSERLKLAIVLGELKPREHLVEDALMPLFAVTRHSMRRALDEIVRVGLAVRHPNRGVQVRDFSAKQVTDLYAIREVLEAKAATDVPASPSPAQLDALRRACDAHRAASDAGDIPTMLTRNNLFHQTLYRLAGNDPLAEAIEHYSVMTEPVRSVAFGDPAARARAVAEHEAIVAAASGRDRALLAQLCVEHIRRPMLAYLALRREGPDALMGPLQAVAARGIAAPVVSVRRAPVQRFTGD